MNKLSWTDQPKVLENTETTFNGRVGEYYVEVRREKKLSDPIWYVTQGNLWGSQTLKCEDVDSVFRALSVIAENRKVNVPRGCTLMEESS